MEINVKMNECNKRSWIIILKVCLISYNDWTLGSGNGSPDQTKSLATTGKTGYNIFL